MRLLLRGTVDGSDRGMRDHHICSGGGNGKYRDERIPFKKTARREFCNLEMRKWCCSWLMSMCQWRMGPAAPWWTRWS